MKKGILLLLVVSSVIANAQTLKDALFSGKLKTDSGTVIRKGDDLSSKIDTTTKKPVVPEKMKTATIARDSSTGLAAQTDSVNIPAIDQKESTVTPKDNNKIWKEYMDSVIGTFKTELLPSKKIKNDTYTILVEYEIDIDGQVTIKNVWPSPEDSYLQQQVKERLNLTAPRLNPVLSGDGKPRKVIKKFNFTLSKT